MLRFPDARSFENLEFRLAFALWRLETGRRPRVAFCPDVPRPSSAEAYEYYRQRQLRDGLARATINTVSSR